MQRRFIKKHLRKDLPVIELGSSIGVIASITAKQTNGELVCVEANPDLIRVIKRNLEINNVNNATIINAAVGYDSSEVYFERGETNLEGKIVNYDDGGMDLVKTVTLENIVSSQNLDNFVLICDIEGTEIQILKYDVKALAKCAQIIIETHETAYKGVVYTSEDMKKMLLDSGFKLTDSYGPNFVFDRTN